MKYELLKKVSAQVSKKQLDEIIKRNLSNEQLTNLIKFYDRKN